MDVSVLKTGAVLEMKKPHACGGSRFTVIREGADRKIKCLTCGRVLCLLPDELLKRVKRVGENA